MKTIVDIINDYAIESVCPDGLKPKTPTEISMVNLFKEFGVKLVDKLVSEKKLISKADFICKHGYVGTCPICNYNN